MFDRNRTPSSLSTKPVFSAFFLEKWENGGGKLAWEAVQRNPVEFVTTTGGAVVGYTSPGDPDATERQRMYRAVLGASAAYAFAKTGKKYEVFNYIINIKKA